MCTRADVTPRRPEYARTATLDNLRAFLIVSQMTQVLMGPELHKTVLKPFCEAVAQARPTPR